ncbi:hypothetical protein [Streptomyces sp. NPDC089799]|uniref:hypothetical protein n=1 Tax=Streptomyces sp. NPDC089799 TaxID=3155066 RepID=UPI003428A93F
MEMPMETVADASAAGGRTGGRTGGHRRQWLLVLGAVAVTVPPVCSQPGLAALLLPPVALPLCLVRHRAGFRAACLGMAGLLLVVPFLLLFLGGGMAAAIVAALAAPAGVLLLLAAYADPRERRRTSAALAGLGALIVAGWVVQTGAWIGDWRATPEPSGPHTFRAGLDAGGRALAGDPRPAQDALAPHGATSVTGLVIDGRAYLEVGFPQDMPQAQVDELAEHLDGVPGVTGVELCPVAKCG